MNSPSDRSDTLDVLHVIPSLGIGGAEQQLAMLTTAARSEPLRQSVVYLLDRDALAGPIREAGVRVERIALDAPWQAPLAMMHLAQLIRRWRPRVVQSWLYYADLLALAALVASGRCSETRLYWGVRCSDMRLQDYSRLLRLTVLACAKLSAWPDAVIANSYAGRDVHIGFGYASPAFGVIPNGIDTDRFRPDAAMRAHMRKALEISDDEPLVLHVARVDPMKDHATLVAIARAMPHIRFAAVGEGTQTISGPANLACLGLRRDVPQLLAAADAFLSTSRYGEGFSNAIAEALASGVPVVATDVGDAKRIIGEAGYLAAPGDAAGLTNALRRLFALAPADRRSLGLRARAHIENQFSVTACVHAFDALHRFGQMPTS